MGYLKRKGPNGEFFGPGATPQSFFEFDNFDLNNIKFDIREFYFYHVRDMFDSLEG